jgi:hypothetical protein
LGELPEKEQAEKLKNEDIKQKKKKRTPIPEEEREERRVQRKKKDLKREIKRRKNEAVFTSKRFNTETPDISPKFLKAVKGKYKGRFFQVNFDPKTGEHGRPKQLSKNQLYILNMNEMAQRNRSLKVEDTDSEEVERLYKA